MLTTIISCLFYTFFVWLGNIMIFLRPASYYSIIIFALFLLPSSLFYKKANCIALEVKDYLFTLVLVSIITYFNFIMQNKFSYSQLSYTFLISFVSFEIFASSKRFKSLIS